ncbi:hypothetical protein [Rheinheimera oceanensis]|uniref:hypothetical protein n=1 Tax=Rheinheimera oceanensis TaxID=2817449 RepID=UPI001BFEEACF|nr:hypothetical protein [Rheinheimera oceanensis]
MGKNNAKESMVEHSKATRVLAYICAVILLPVYVSGPIALILISGKRLSNADASTVFILAALVIGITYLCGKYFFLMVRFLRSLKTKMTYDDQGIALYKGSETKRYSWNDLKASREYASCQIFCLMDSSKTHLFSIWEYASGYREFRQKMYEEVGI